MRKIVILAFLMLIIVVASAEKRAPLTIDQKAFILSRFCTEVKYNFVHYNKLAFDWDSLCMSELPMLCKTENDADFIRGLMRLNARLKDGHTFIITDRGLNDGPQQDWMKPFPMTTRLIDGCVVVDKVESKMLESKGVVRGSEILSVDGEDIKDYCYRNISPEVHSSTSQWTDYMTFCGHQVTLAPGNKVSTFELRTPEGKLITISSNRNDLDWDLRKENVYDCFEFRVIDGNIGYLNVKSFAQGRFKKDDFDTIYKKIQRTGALILDLRNNGGGNSAYADYLMSHFVDSIVPKGEWRSRKYIAAHASWNMPMEWHSVGYEKLYPISNKNIYDRPICVLVSERTFSSAENFCALFKNASRGKIIGVATGGSTGNPIIIDLGYDVRCAICTKEDFLSDGTPFVGIGILPDVAVKETMEAFLLEKDIVLECAIEEVKGTFK